MNARPWPDIAVVGAGAVGCYFGGMLARAGMKVTLIGRPLHVDAIARNGLRFQSGDFDKYIAIAASTDVAAVRGAGLILFCVKSPDTDEAAAAMAPQLAPDAIVISLQNGVDNVGRIRRHTGNRVIAGLVYAAAEMSAPGTVRHTGGGNLVIGTTGNARADDDHRVLDDIAELFAAANVPVRISDAVETELWTKLVMNCAYNAISALGAAPYSRMVAMPDVRDVMRDAVIEVMALAKAKGVPLPDTLVEDAFKLADAMPQTLSSTTQDIAKGKRTEIDHLNGYVVREGKALGVPTPVNRVLHALVKLLEQSRAGPD
jgi:2-dehydropantoate 2-reductase